MKSQDPPVEHLQTIVNLFTDGKLQQALNDSNELLEKFPNSIVLCNITGAANAGLMKFDAAIESYKKALKINPDYADAYYNMAIVLNDKGESELALEGYRQALKIKPNYADAYINMGVILKEMGDLEAAIKSYKQALKIKPNYAEAYNNMGIALKDKGDLEAAIDSYNQAVKINPNYAEAYNNIGNSHKDKGDPESAINSYKKALKITPNSSEVYNNMGIALKDKGDLEAAIDSYKKALKITPNYAEAQENLVSLLTSYSPQKDNPNLIVKVNEEIRKVDIKDNTSKIISDDQIVSLFSRSEDCISGFSIDLKTKLSQVYRRSSVNLDCTRHMSIFNKHDIIPEFCFGCYKVQIEPRSIIQLIKLFVVFDQLELQENNTRKCMIELRPKISGFYKGLIYCSSLKDANQIAVHLDIIIKQSIDSGLTAKVKRGCSEYPISYPDYKEINNSDPQLMNYREEWKVIEDAYDRKQSIYFSKYTLTSLSGLNLSDVLIIRKWIDYAKGIGDPSADLLNQDTVYYQDIYDRAKARIDPLHLTTL